MAERNHPGDGGPAVWLIRGDADLQRWIEMTGDVETTWLEGRPGSAHPFAPWIDVARGHPSGEAVARRMTTGPLTAPDEDSPVLPDRFGAFALVASWLGSLATTGRRVAVFLREAPTYTQDSFDLLVFLTRSLGPAPISILLEIATGAPTTAWQRTLGILGAEVGLKGEITGAGSGGERRLSQSNASEAIQFCHTGAVQDGSRMLASAIAADGGNSHAWQTLAMVGLLLQRDEMVALSVANVLSSEASGRLRARSLRTWMLALRRTNRPAELRTVGELGETGAVSAAADAVPVSWRHLDRALATSVDPDPREHVDHLERALALPASQVTDECRATALIWRGAAHYATGKLADAGSLLADAAALLDDLGELVRSQHVRARYGMALAATGRRRAALPVLAQATCDAFAIGQPDVAAVCATEHAVASLSLGLPVSPTHAGDLADWRARMVWESGAGKRLSGLVSARVALADGRLDEAVIHTERLLAEASNADFHVPAGRVRLMTEAAFLHCDIAAARGQDDRPWLLAACRWTEMAPPEERPILRARGDARRSPALLG
jgi:hypothetical protein